MTIDVVIGFGKALADPTRVRILSALGRGELCVCELVDILEINQSTLSTHLQTLRALDMVKAEKRRQWIIYSIHPDAKSVLQGLFERLPLTKDTLIQEDTERLQNRISLRVDGCCVVGPSKTYDKKAG